MQKILVHTQSYDSEKIKIAKRWLQTSRLLNGSKLLSSISVPRDFRLTPDLISAYASALNTLLPNERVTDYVDNHFLTVKKEIFPQVCHNKNFNDISYYLTLDAFGWHIL